MARCTTPSGRRKSNLSPACPSTASCESSTAPARKGEGINIGKEWTYRKYLDGGTPMAAIWTFTGITPERFPDGKLPLEMLLRVFRTYKGKIADEKKNNRTVGILSSLELVNPEQPSMKSNAIIFTAKDQVIDKHYIPRKLERNTENGVETIDLFDDLVTKEDGQHRLELVLRCLSPSQYVGVAEGDVYLKSSNGSYPLEFRQGLFRHLDADGAGRRLRRDVEHVLERPGGDFGHARHADHGLLHQRRRSICSRP